jgi:hypothetical protein
VLLCVLLKISAQRPPLTLACCLAEARLSAALQDIALRHRQNADHTVPLWSLSSAPEATAT